VKGGRGEAKGEAEMKTCRPDGSGITYGSASCSRSSSAHLARRASRLTLRRKYKPKRGAFQIEL